jgi:RNA polymerase sigma factor (sigma-70 family)
MGTSTATVARAIQAAIRADWSALSDRELLRQFAEEGNQDAFAALVRRHSGLVLGVCRRAFLSPQDAEDACQATFLLLARKARGQPWEPSVANWLHATARRVAGNARQAAQRREKREGRAAVLETVEPADQLTARELLAALDEELGRLPARYREPLVLCYLEGLTRDEAARRLGVPGATLKSQLERGRKKLGDALARRGCGLGAGLLTLAVTSPAGASSPRLVQAVLASVSGAPPATVAALAKGASVNVFVSKSMLAVFALVTAIMLGGGLAALPPAASPRAEKAQLEKVAEAVAKAKAERPPAGKKESVVSGRVLRPDGKPLAGAELLLLGRSTKGEKFGVTDGDGRFKVRAPRKRWVVLLARAPGVGADFIDLGLAPAGEIELRTVKDAPIRGRVIDTQGKPVVGATVAVSHVGGYANESVDSFLAAWKNRDPHSGVPTGIKHVSDERAFRATTTGKDGRFTVTGVGAERVVTLRLRGAGIAESEVMVVNRAGFDPKPYNKATADRAAMTPFSFGLTWLLYGPGSSFVVEAARPIRGIVKDRDTGAPRAGVKVTLSRSGNDLLGLPLSATTDAKGRYEIRGARKAEKGYMVEVESDPATGHMATQVRAADTPGYGPITLDVAVKKGAIITGRVIDRATGKALPGFVMASVLTDNPFAKDYPDFSSSAFFATLRTADDGTFRVVTIPGPVILMGGADTQRMPEGDIAYSRYKPPVPDPKYPKYFSTKKGQEGAFYGLGGGITPIQGSFCKVLEIEPGARLVKQDIVLERASALPVRVVDSAGRPVSGTWVTGIGPENWHRPVRIAKDTCSAYHLQPGKARLLVFHDPVRKLFGVLRLKGDEKEKVVVKLGPAGSVKGRIVGEDGRPLAGATVRLHHRERTAEEMHEHVHRAIVVETDADGKFRMDEVVPGVTFGLWFTRGRRSFEPADKLEGRMARPGKVLDLGNVKVRPERAGQEE